MFECVVYVYMGIDVLYVDVVLVGLVECVEY